MIHQESVGDEFAGYRIEGVIRHGGMATVYQARHLVLQRPAALKVLAPALARDQRFRARFLGESRTAASLDHPHIVPIYDAGEAHGVLYIAMRLIEGADLRALLEAERRLEPRRAVALLSQVASALDAAHTRGLVHRDVKPSNILVAAPAGPHAAEQAYLADFGITKQLDAEGLTATSEFLGTIDYMSPEQIEGLALDGRADVYALGCVLHQCLTGVAPFAADSVVGVMHAHLTKRPPRLSAADSSLPGGLDAVVAAALAKSPAERPSTCTALLDAARAALDSPRRRPAAPPFVPTVAPAPSPAPPSPPTSPSVPARRLPAAGAPATAASTPGGAAAGAPPTAAARPAAAAWPATAPVLGTPPPVQRRARGRTPGGVRRWRAVLAGVAALVLLGVMAAATVRGIQGPSTGGSGRHATGILPLPTPSPPLPTTVLPAPSPTGAGTPTPSPSHGLLVVPTTPTPAAGPRPTATAHPSGPTRGPTAAPSTAAPAPPSAAPSWSPAPPANSTAGCEPNWAWSCNPPPSGKCHTVAVYTTDSGPLPSAPASASASGKDYAVTVPTGGYICARWSNAGVHGSLTNDQGAVVDQIGDANGGFVVWNLPAGTYHLRLRHVDASTPDSTSLQINTT